MKGKIVWLVLSCLMVLSLVLASCTPAAEEGEATTVVGKVTEEEAVVVEEEEEEEVVAPTGPQYGGVATLVLAADVAYFDEVAGGNYGGHVYAGRTKFTHNDLLQGDWAKGPAGTNETDWINGGDNRDRKSTRLNSSH